MNKPQIITISYRDKPDPEYKVIDVTSKGRTKFKMLSTYLISNVYCYLRYSARNLNNAMVFSGVYTEHDNNGEPLEAWYTWRNDGFSCNFPLTDKLKRPPLYYYWNGVIYKNYEFRKNILLPLYEKHVPELVLQSLRRECESGKKLALRDFTYGFQAEGMTIKDVFKSERPISTSHLLYKILTNENI